MPIALQVSSASATVWESGPQEKTTKGATITDQACRARKLTHVFLIQSPKCCVLSNPLHALKTRATVLPCLPFEKVLHNVTSSRLQ